jgi:hypothetical protein
MEAQSPVRLHRRQSDDLRVLLDHLSRAGPGKEVEVEDTTHGVVLEVLARLLGVVDEDIHAVGVEQEDAVRAALALLKVQRVAAVKVRARWDGVAVAVPEGADVVRGIQPEGVGVLAEAEQERVIGKACPQAEVLRFEDERCGGGVKQDFVRIGAGDGKGEGLLGVIELEVAPACRAAAAWSGNDRLGDLVDLVVLVLDLDVEPVVYTVSFDRVASWGKRELPV